MKFENTKKILSLALMVATMAIATVSWAHGGGSNQSQYNREMQIRNKAAAQGYDPYGAEAQRRVEQSRAARGYNPNFQPSPFDQSGNRYVPHYGNNNNYVPPVVVYPNNGATSAW